MYLQPVKRNPPPFHVKAEDTYLGEDEHGYYVLEGFFDGIGNMFKRMVKFTPKSFTPSNIFKAFRNTTLTTMTGGAYLVLPKNVKKTMENVANVALPVAATVVGASLVSPSIMPALMSKFSAVGKVMGKAVGEVGTSLINNLGKLNFSQQAKIAEKVTTDDIEYAERHGGELPPHIMKLINEAEKQAFAYGAMQAAQSNVQLPPAQPAFYSNSSLYPAMKNAGFELEPPPGEPQGIGTPAIIGLSVGAGALLIYLLGGPSGVPSSRTRRVHRRNRR